MDTRPAVHLFSALPAPLRLLSPSAEAVRCLAARGRGQRIARATRHLLRLGHRRILLVSGSEQDARLTNADMYGHAQVMLAEGLPLLPRLELGSAVWPELAALLEEIAPTVLLCTGKTLALGLAATLRGHGDLASLLIVSPEFGSLDGARPRH
ncbi:substrate-binding domain-containing protein [uncultured Pseudomonas sp.]|uniref:substrate-binding domain-containing protein n=1 Tax=uncultured Pseudomonas sp. TaxID=114707 RepID=UPI0025E57DC2|nr:substrate-binding domain-containing protein [uncultured Pseudomonas sp.]